jgi:glycosyltransferase involved in cell wall biosynthesis
MADPCVTVITPVFNRPVHLARALESLVAQSYTDFECIVVDDASQDSPSDIVEQLDDRRFRFIRRETNGGPVAARMTGFRAARGDVIACLDSDNEFYPWTLERAVALLDANPGAGCVTGMYVYPDGFRTRVATGTRLVVPEEYRRISREGDSDCVGIVRAEVVAEWLKRRADYYSLEFHLVFWMALNYNQLYVDEPWGLYHTDANNRVTSRRDPREYLDPVKFAEDYRPLLGTESCLPLDEYLVDAWFLLRRAHRVEELAVVKAWMRERGLTNQRALRWALTTRVERRLRRHPVKIM